MSSKDEYKIYSFESNSAGGIICALLYAKIPFKYKKIDVEDWDEKKAKFDYEPLPVLKLNQNQYTHEIPVMLYLGRKLDLLGSSNDDEYLTSSLLYAVNDMKEKILPAFLPETTEEYECQQEKIDELLNKTFPFYLKAFNAHLTNKRYFLGDKITIIDLYMCYFVTLIFKHPLRCNLLDPILSDNAPDLNSLVISLSQNELKDYFANYYQLASPL